MNPRRIPFLLVIAALTACNAIPQLRQPTAPVPPAWHGDAATSLDTTPPHLAWWQSFNDPILTTLITRAAANNLDLKIATARVQAARAAVDVSGAAQAPQLAATGTFRRQTDEIAAARAGRDLGAANAYQVGFDASWELDLFGGVRASVVAARADAVGAEEARREILLSLLAEVARAYVELRGAEEQLAVVNKNIARQQDTLALAETRTRAGLGPELDAVKAATELNVIAATLPRFETSIRSRRNRLAVLLGEPPAALDGQLVNWAATPAGVPVVPLGLPSGLLGRRPDIRRAQAQVLAANARVGVAHAALFPRFFISGALAAAGEDYGRVNLGPGTLFALGPVVQLPILNGGRLRSNIEIKDAQLRSALASYERAVLVALEDVENALVAYRHEQVRSQTLSTAVAQAATAEQLARELYQRGLADYFAVLDAQRARFDAEDQLAASSTKVAVELIALYKALGGGWEEFEAQAPPDVALSGP